MVRNKNPFVRAAAFVTAMAIAFMTVMIFPAETLEVGAEGTTINYADAVDLDPSTMTVTGANLLINGAKITADTTIKDGDSISFDFSWTLQNGVDISKPFRIKLSDYLQGIELGNDKSIDDKGTVHEIKDGYLYILVSSELSPDNRKGGCALSGTAQVSGLDDDNDGNVSLEYFGQIEIVPLTPVAPDPDPVLSVYKSTSGDVYYDAGSGKYYQDYTITVESRNAESTNVTVTDTPPYIMGAGGISDVKVDGASAAFTGSGSDYVINLGTIEKNGKKVITYTMEIDRGSLTSDNWNNEENKAKAENDEGSEPAYGSAHASYSKPSLNKSGAYNEADGTITWTLTYYANVLKNANVTFNISDTLGTGFEADAFSGLPTGAVISADGKSFTIPSSALTDKGNGVYELVYKTDVPASVIGSPTATTMTNKADVDYDDDTLDGPSANAGVTIPAGYSDFVEKSVAEGSDPESGINWKVIISIPDNDEVSGVYIEDSLTTTNSWESCADVAFDYSSFAFKGYDESGSAKTYTLSEVIDNSKWNYKNDQSFGINLRSSFVENNRGKDVVLTYSSAIVSGCDYIYYCRNYTKATLTIGSGSVSDDDEVIFKKGKIELSKENIPASSLSGKFPYSGIDSLRNPLGWCVKALNANHTDYQVGDKIIIEDILPEGYEYVEGSVGICNNSGVAPGNITDWGNHWFGDKYKSAVSVNYDSAARKLTITITVNNEMMGEVSSDSDINIDKSFIEVGYITQMTEEMYKKCYTDYTEEQTLTFINRASYKINTKSWGTVSAQGTVKINPDKTLDKTVTTRKDDGYYYADYVVKINQDAVKLNGGANYTIEDVMGTNLTVVASSVSITPSGGASYTLSEDNRTITLTLKDETAYTLKYTAKIKQIAKNDTLDPDSAEFFEKFGNTVSYITDANFNNNNRKVTLSSDYKSTSWSQADEKYTSISISGTKTWVDSKTFNGSSDRGGRPSKIGIVLTVNTYASGSTVPVVSEQTFEVDMPAREDMTWSYTIDDLKTLDTDGTRYTYAVKEITVDGYSVSYSCGSAPSDISASKNNYTFTMTDAASATRTGSIGYGRLVVTTTETSAAAFDIEVSAVQSGTKYSYDKNSSGITYTRSSDGRTFTFDNVPLYIFDTNDVATAFDYYVSGKQLDVSITNTFTAAETEVGKVVITKVWNDNNNTSERPQIDFVITGSDGRTYDKNTHIIDANGRMTSALHYSKSGDTYTFDKLPIYTYTRDANDKLVRTPIKYYITETADDASKLAAYSQNGTGTAYTFDLTGGSAVTVSQTTTNRTVTNSVGSVEVSISKVDAKNAGLAGAVIVIKDESGSEVDRITSASAGNKINLIPGKYTLEELSAPTGYEKAASIEFTVHNDGTIDSTAVNNGVIVMVDEYEKYSLSIIKNDENGNGLSGAKLQVFDSKGSVVEEWTTDGTARTLELPFGKYTIHEVSAPTGYKTAINISFEIKADGTIVSTALQADGSIAMTDKFADSTVTISKTDENGNALAGAILSVTKNGATNSMSGVKVSGRTSTSSAITDGRVYSATEGSVMFMTTNTAAVLENLPMGTYTLTELTAPSGYEKADPIVFTVDNLGNITDVNGEPVTGAVTMLDLYAKHDAQICKTDESGNVLSGADLKITDANGTLIKSWTTGATAETVSLKPGTYTLTEIKAPTGYKLAEPIIFTVDIDGVIKVNGVDVNGVITMIDKANDGKVSIRKTDENNILIDGAQLKLTKVGDTTFSKTWTSDSSAPYSIQLTAGTYVLEETAAPVGYDIAAAITFTVAADSTVTIGGNDVNGTVTMVDVKSSYNVKLLKTDENGIALSGAKLQVLDENGTTAAEWTTDGTAKILSLTAGKYTLHEVSAPTGYTLAADIAFEVKADGTIVSTALNANNEIVMVDRASDDYYVVVSKRDLFNDRELSGATLAIKDIDGNIVAQWISDGNAKTISGLNAGTYELVEINPPIGYLTASPVRFTVDDAHNGQIITMYDTPIYFYGGDDDDDDDVSANAPIFERENVDRENPYIGFALLFPAAAIILTIAASRKRKINK